MPPISFARGAPAPELIPAAELAECAHAVALREGAKVFAYGPGGGYAPLREWVAARHGVEPEPGRAHRRGASGLRLLRGGGSSRDAGRVLVEAPSYDRPLKILAREGAEIVLARDGRRGARPRRARGRARAHAGAPSFLYTIPTFQNPSGRTLSSERRRGSSRSPREHDLAVLEDDPYGLVRFEGEAPEPLHELEGGERVTYTSSFSKTVAPGLRTGYFVLPAARGGGFEARAVSTYISPPFLPQATSPSSSRAAASSRTSSACAAELRARRDAMLGALERDVPGGRIVEPARGRLLRLARARTRAGRVGSRRTRRGRRGRVRAAAGLLSCRLGRRAQLGARSRSATSRRSGSPRGSSCSRALVG